MTRMILLAFLFVLLSLSGCATTLPASTNVVVQETLTVVKIDETYLTDCPVEPAIPPDIYIKMGKDEREAFLTQTLIKQWGNTTKCNEDKHSIRSLQEKQLKEVEAYNARQKAIADEQVAKLREQ